MYVNNIQEWDDLLDFAMFSYNISVHEGTLYTTFELVYGTIARAPSSDSQPNTESGIHNTYTQYMKSLNENLNTLRNLARENLIRAKKRYKYYYDKRTQTQAVNIEDKVYLLKEPNRYKLGDRYTGPYRVIEILPHNNVKLAISRNKTRTVHLDKVKLYTCGRPLTPTPRTTTTTADRSQKQRQPSRDT